MSNRIGVKAPGGSGSLGERCGFHRPHELIAFHGDGDFPGGFTVQTVAAEDLAKATDAYGRVAAGESDEVLDPSADFDFLGGKEAHAS